MTEANMPALENKAGAKPGDLDGVIADFMGAFEEFKATNDARLDAIEKRGSADTLLDDKLKRLDQVLDGHKSTLDRLATERARPRLEGGRPEAGEEYKQAFSDYVKHGETKALSTGSGPDGGYLVPAETETEVTRLLTAISPMRAICGVRQVSGSVYKKPITVAGPQVGWVGETASRTQTTSQTIDELTFPTTELYAMPAATQAFLDDAAVDVGQWIAEEVNAAFAEQETAAFILGDGVNKPAGFLDADIVAEASWSWEKLGYVATGVDGAFPDGIDPTDASDVLIDLVYALKAGYGGTPSDTSVVAAIRDLKARGLEVTLYPFVMMDIPADNALPNPYGGTGQPAYPWRGRITCDPAPGRPGSVDKTAGAAAQVADFVAGGYREMVLHYAGLAEAAGGVDALLIGSELVGLTTVRDGASSFPFVTALRALAGEARSVVGAGTRLSYAADWSEYFGYQPADGSGDRLFHLDPLWADANIDAVGIDNYMPISDWREEGGPDAPAAVSPYDLDYLGANIAGGEGFDWYYASEADRQAGMRTPIGDGAYGEPWVYRFKDIVSWWSRPHHNRIGGVRDPNPTAWVPGSKPIWMTEIGCGAVDKGTNAPNAFGDPKSAEDKRPYFSSGAPDALMQRQALRAIHRHWQGGGDNPQGMVDPDRLYVWCWDARPFPAFPGRDDVWSDAANYETGHWLNGRLGAAGAGEMLAAMAEDYGVAVAEVADPLPLVTGCAIEQVTSLREAGAALVDVAGLVVADTPQGLRFALPDARQVTRVMPEDLVRDEGPVFGRRRGDPAEAVGRLTLHALDRGRDYQSMSVVALAEEGEAVAVEQSGLVLEPMDLRRAAEQRLARLAQAADSVEAILPPEALAIEPGDLLDIDGVADGPFLVEETRGVSGQAIKARRWARVPVAVFSAERRRMWTPELALVAPPAVVAAHLPAEGGASRLVAGAFASPWPGEVSLRDGETRLAGASRAAVLGVAETALGPGAQWMWDREGALDVTLYAGHLASRDEGAVLDGANRLAVRTAAGWEVIGFAGAELTGARRYRLTGLLRGLEGTAAGAVDIGAHVLVLGPGLAEIAVPAGRVGGDWSLRAYAGTRDAHGVPVAVDLDFAPARLLAPVHVTAAQDASGDIALRWVRRARGGVEWAYGEVLLDAAPERYRVTIRDGATALRVIEADGPEARYAAAEQDADWGGPAPDFAFTVEQISPASGPGAKAWGAFHG